MASRSLNKVLLIGNLTRDPELRSTPKGNSVCSFSIATNSTWKDSDGNVQEIAEFHNIVAWNKLAEICAQILKMGMKVYVEGEIRTRSWENKDDGAKHTKTEIRIKDMKVLSPLTREVSENVDLSSKNKAEPSVVAEPVKDASAPEEDINSIDDLPF